MCAYLWLLCALFFWTISWKRLTAEVLPVLQPASTLARVLACSVDVCDFHRIDPFSKDEHFFCQSQYKHSYRSNESSNVAAILALRSLPLPVDHDFFGW